MSHAGTNTAKFYSKIGEFFDVGMYTDVTVTCGEQDFSCHRLTLASASNFFNTRLSADFKAGEVSHVVLENTSAKTFEEVLKFVYTGHVAITNDNLFKLLEASEFFNMAELQDLCVEFLQENKIVGESILEWFAFARTAKNTSLLKLLSQDILLQLDELRHSKTFLELSFDALNAILSQLSDLSSRETMNDEFLLSAIIQWVEHARHERRKYFEKMLFATVHFRNMTAEYMKFVIRNMYNPAVIAKRGAKKKNMAKRSSNLEVPKMSVVARDCLQMHVYVKHGEEDSMTRISFVESVTQCSISDEKISTTKSKRIRCVPAVNQVQLYCLYINNTTYSEKINYTNGNQLFCMYASADMQSRLDMTQPPIIFGDANLCTLKNNIYADDHPLFPRIIMKTSSQSLKNFNEEEITRGIYLYSCEVDDWFPVPMMKEKLQDSCMVSCDDVLYVIGEVANISPRPLQNRLQSYDYRSGTWQLLPSTSYFHEGGDCCVLNNKIYYCGNEGTEFERYDITAGKWESLTPMLWKTFYHRVIPYSNELWLMGDFADREGALSDRLVMQIYEPAKDSWSTSTQLKETVEKKFGAYKECSILDGVVLSYL